MPHPVILLGVNIDHAATLRQARYRDVDAQPAAMVEPDPIAIALLAEKAGADGITAHLREDRRHIQDRDIRRLRESVTTRLNMEMACTDEMVRIALELRPDICCLVPEGREEITTEGGLDLTSRERREQVSRVLGRLSEAGVRTSLFVDPEHDALTASAELGADAVELHTGGYANARGGREREERLTGLAAAAARARELGLAVHAGHGLTYENVAPVAAIRAIEELNIGHAIVSRAVFTGLEAAVREMARVLRRARGKAG